MNFQNIILMHNSHMCHFSTTMRTFSTMITVIKIIHRNIDCFMTGNTLAFYFFSIIPSTSASSLFSMRHFQNFDTRHFNKFPHHYKNHRYKYPHNCFKNASNNHLSYASLVIFSNLQTILYNPLH